MLSQLAAAGKVKRMFSHCLDTVNGGGIFSIGQLVEPKLNATAPLIPHKYVCYLFGFQIFSMNIGNRFWQFASLLC